MAEKRLGVGMSFFQTKKRTTSLEIRLDPLTINEETEAGCFGVFLR